MQLYGIVSPCSGCNNKRTVATAGMASCPRLVLQKQVQDLKDQGLPTDGIDYLATTGTDSQSLANPVYWDEGHTTLVWIALLKDNQGAHDANSNLITPHILSDSFDNTYINCHAYPFVPRDTEAAYRAGGALAEGCEVEVTLTPPQQQLTSPDDNGNYPAVLIDGFVRKFNFAFSSPRVQIDRDLCIPGT